MERHVPELCDQVRNNNEAAPMMPCPILDGVSWFPGVLQQLWIDVSVRCPACRTLQRKCVGWRSGENEALCYGLAIVGLRDLWKTGRRKHQVAA